jgi:ElaB/YqjD/DUF883 family membrane-anchored ribosome-binding protein
MDANNRESAADVGKSTNAGSGAAARMKRNAEDVSQDAKETLNDLGRKAADTFENTRHTTANALEWTADSLHSGTDQVSGFAHSAADRLQETAEYMHETNFDRFVEDVQRIVKRYPGRWLAAAAIVGFVVARVVGRISD